MKDNQQVRPVADLAGNRVLFHVRGYADPLILEMGKVAESIQKRAALVGMAQVRIVDAAAVERKDRDGNIRTEQEMLQIKYDRMSALIEHYHTGTEEWTVKASGSAGPSKGITVEAISRMRGITYDEAATLVVNHAKGKHGGDMPKALAFLRKDPRLMKVINEIRAERAAAMPAEVDIMAEFDSLGEEAIAE